MNSKFLTIIGITFVMLFFSGKCSAQKNVKATPVNIQVIQFHAEHRCVTCNLIETLSRETLRQNFKHIPFKLVNADDKNNEKIAEEFQASGTALFLYNPVTKKKKDLTNFAFMNAKTKPEEFKKGLKKEIENFK